MYHNLEAELRRKNIRREDLAKILHLNISTVSRKLTTPGLLKLAEAVRIKTQCFPDLSMEYLFSESFENN